MTSMLQIIFQGVDRVSGTVGRVANEMNKLNRTAMLVSKLFVSGFIARSIIGFGRMAIEASNVADEWKRAAEETKTAWTRALGEMGNQIGPFVIKVANALAEAPKAAEVGFTALMNPRKIGESKADYAARIMGITQINKRPDSQELSTGFERERRRRLEWAKSEMRVQDSLEKRQKDNLFDRIKEERQARKEAQQEFKKQQAERIQMLEQEAAAQLQAKNAVMQAMASEAGSRRETLSAIATGPMAGVSQYFKDIRSRERANEKLNKLAASAQEKMAAGRTVSKREMLALQAVQSRDDEANWLKQIAENTKNLKMV